MNKNVVYITILAIIFGVLGGALTNLLNHTYLEDEFYFSPFSSEIDISDSGIGQSNVVIEGAKKLVVEQDKRIKETEESIKKSIVRIFPARNIEKEQETNSTSTIDQAIQNNKYYRSGEEKGAGLIVTGDGWVLTNTFPVKTPISDIKERYRVVTSDNKIKKIGEVIKNKENDIIFLRLKEARDLPVIKLGNRAQIDNGDIVIATNHGEKNLVTNITEKRSFKKMVRSSDSIEQKLILSHKLNNYYDNNSFVFNLDKELVGLQTPGSDQITSITQFHSSISSLLKIGEIKTPTLGVRYIDLSEMVMSKKYPERGALIYSISDQPAIIPDTPAQESELQAGDIIMAVNNKNIDKGNELAHVVHEHLPGEKLDIYYQRKGEKKRVEVKLK